jgi:leucyl/phenylalanyl-tRNA--protein transferase
MFATVPNASMVAFVHLVRRLERWGFTLIDCQQETEHLARFGGESWPRKRFLSALRLGLAQPTRRGPWAKHEPEE